MAKEHIDFSNLTNSEINLKMKGFENEYNIKKDKIINLIADLKELDELYIEAKAEMDKRGTLWVTSSSE